MQNPPKNHHYVPQFYLKGFGIANSDSKKPVKFWVHSAGKKSRYSNTKAEAFEIELHTIQAAGEEPDRSIETDLSKIEGQHALILRKIIKDKGGQNLTAEENRKFAEFVGLQIVRTPTYFHFFKQMSLAFNEALEEALRGDLTKLILMSKNTPDGMATLKDFSPETIKKWLSDEKLQSHIHLMGIGKTASGYANILLNEMSWFFPIASDGRKFCTCDDPVIVLSKEGNRYHEGIGKDVKIIFPLSSEIYFYADRDSKATPPSVDEVNEKVTWQAYRFIYSEEENPGIDTHLKQREESEKSFPRDDVRQMLADLNT